MNTRAIMKQLNAMLVNIEATYLTIARNSSLTYDALMMLYMVADSKHLTQKQVCDALYLSKSTVHSMLSMLGPLIKTKNSERIRWRFTPPNP